MIVPVFGESIINLIKEHIDEVVTGHTIYSKDLTEQDCDEIVEYMTFNYEELFELAKKMEKHGGYFLKGTILLLAIIIGLLIVVL